MKAKSLILSLAVGILAALPAQAGSGLIKITRATHVQTAASTVAKAQRTASHASSEIQVAVMAAWALQPAPRRGVYIHR